VLDDADPGQRDGDGEDLVADERAQGHAEDGEQCRVGEGAGEDESDVVVAVREARPVEAEHGGRRGEARGGGDQPGAEPDRGAGGQLGENHAVASGRCEEGVGGGAVPADELAAYCLSALAAAAQAPSGAAARRLVRVTLAGVRTGEAARS
jgi:hypothetical protein